MSEDFVSTQKALDTIFPQASDTEIAKYESQLDNVDILDPVLIISANQSWINQYQLPAYQAVMDAFATDGLTNKRRDKGSRSIFHFASIAELYTVRSNIRRLHPNAFFLPPRFQNQIPTAQRVPIGTAWILTKVKAHKSDCGQDDSFFVIH